MSNKIKFYLGILALIALFSVLTFFNSLKSSPSAFLKPLTGSMIEAVDQDTDKDGLANREESYWNTDPNEPDTDGDKFLDGEEVASGHDPMKPGPDDLLPSSGAVNITDKVSALMAAGFYAGDLSNSADPAVYDKALADISAEMMIDGIRSLDPDNVVVGKTILSSDDSKKAQEKYLDAIGLIIQDIWGEITSEPRLATENFVNFYSDNERLINGSKNYFNSKKNYYNDMIARMNAVAVPPSWLNIHNQIISNLQALAVSHKILGQTDEDPLKGTFGMSNLIQVYQTVQPILVEITDKVKKNDLNPPNGQLWSLINSLTDGF